jgi:hippurate hydrolase
MSWYQVIEQAIESRHWLHRRPELTWEEKDTAVYIRDQLSNMGISWRACATFGTVATLAPDSPGEHLAFRSDMDALPISETADVDFCSEVPGKMHACGHDGHMAALLGLANWLKQNEDRLNGPVSLLFQPAEEGGHGARKMVEDGALDGVDAIFGWHNWPALPAGMAVCPDGVVMSGNGTFHMTIQGRGGHASQPEAARDPVVAAAAITLNMQQIVSRRLPPQVAAVVTVASIIADSGVTVIPDQVKIEGSIRISDPAWRQQINELIVDIANNTSATYGVSADVEIRPRYEATVNHPVPAQRYRDALLAELGEGFDHADILVPIMASEDFSYYLQAIPGAFALVGMSEQVADRASFQHPCHSPEYEFNDRVIEPVIRVFSRIAGIPVDAAETGQTTHSNA